MPSDVEQRLRPRPGTGYVFRTTWPVATGDIDADLHLRLDGVARYIQEVGAQNLVDAGEAEEHPHWLVQRTVIDVIEPIEYPDEISFSRWCSALSSRWCTMRVDLDGSTGGHIETEGFWIAINSATLTPQRVSDSLVEKFASTTDEHRLKWKPWLTDPDVAAGPDGTAEAAPFPLRRTDIDIFEHVTNTAYWHAVHEVMALVPESCRPPYRAVVEYRRPIRYGEDVSIRWVPRAGAVHGALAVGDEVRAAVLVRRL